MRRGLRTVALGVVLVTASACGGDGGDDGSAPTTEAPTTEAPTTRAEVPDDLCALLDEAGAPEASGLDLADGVADGGDGRSVCAFGGGPGLDALTVGVDDGDFEEKADTSRRAVRTEGDEIEGLGDRALFLFGDTEATGGLGGLLVDAGGLTIDVTIQGVTEEERAREAATVLAEAVVAVLETGG